MAPSQGNGTTYRKSLCEPGDFLTRFALATLVGSDRFWASFFVLVPVGLVAVSALEPVVAAFAVGVVPVLCLWLLWMSDEFVFSVFEADVGESRVEKSKPYSDDFYDPIQSADIAGISILQFSGVALLRIRYKRALASKPGAVVVAADCVSDVRSTLAEMGVDVSVTRTSLVGVAPSLVHLRVLGTPLVLAGSLGGVVYLHGVSVFTSDSFVVPVFVLVAFALYGVVYRIRAKELT